MTSFFKHYTVDFFRSANIDGVVKSPISCVVADREMLNIPYVCLRFRGTTTPESNHESYQINADLICEISQQEYGGVNDLLKNLFVDLADLYEGKWPLYEACEVGYHNLAHTIDVALAVARMAAGWNRGTDREPISEELFLAGITAALFHDTGYIKDKGDHEGKGGKYTFNHVARSIRIANEYLLENEWPEAFSKMVPRLIRPTDFHKNQDLAGMFDSESEENLARMLATADMVSQMADVDYITRISDLFEEFQEAYKHETLESLTKRGVQVYTSTREIIDGTLTFYEQFVLPRLERFGRMDRYLASFFNDGRNPYQENIAANLSGHLLFSRSQWNRLGEILEQLGLVSNDQIEQAVERQLQLEDRKETRSVDTESNHNSRLISWLNRQDSSNRLGEILLDMDIIDSADLCQGLLAQILPTDLLIAMSREETIFLLQVSIILHNPNKGVHIFNCIMEMMNELIGCETSTIHLVDDVSGKMFAAVPLSVESNSSRMENFGIDKGLTGWVYRHGKPVAINNGYEDSRFFPKPVDSAHKKIKSILVVPFHINGHRVGVLELLNKKDSQFTEHDTEIVTCLINIMGTVLGNTLSLQRLLH